MVEREISRFEIAELIFAMSVSGVAAIIFTPSKMFQWIFPEPMSVSLLHEILLIGKSDLSQKEVNDECVAV